MRASMSPELVDALVFLPRNPPLFRRAKTSPEQTPVPLVVVQDGNHNDLEEPEFPDVWAQPSPLFILCSIILYTLLLASGYYQNKWRIRFVCDFWGRWIERSIFVRFQAAFVPKWFRTFVAALEKRVNWLSLETPVRILRSHFDQDRRPCDHSFILLGNRNNLSWKSWPFTAMLLERGRTAGDCGRKEWWWWWWWGGGVTTIMRPRGHDQERGGLTTYQRSSTYRLKPHAGKGTGHAEQASWERLIKNTGRMIIIKEGGANESTWSTRSFVGLFRNCRRRRQPGSTKGSSLP